MSYNKVILQGNLTKDPEIKYNNSGLAICNFDIAVNDSFKDGNALFIRIVTFNKQAENSAQYLKKGLPVLVDGRLQISSWEGEDGQKRSRPEIVASVVQFLGGKRGKSDDSVAISDIVPDAGNSTDDIPF